MDKLEIPEAAVEALADAFFDACEEHGELEWMALQNGRVEIKGDFPKDPVFRALAAALPHMPDRGYAEVAPTHRHKKRGSEYVLIGYGAMQAENWTRPVHLVEGGDTFEITVDMDEVAIYRSVDDGSLWVRPREEFEDGRFEALVPATPAPADNGNRAAELEAALKGLVLLLDLFEASDHTHADAFFLLAQQPTTWCAAREALSSVSATPSPIEDVAGPSEALPPATPSQAAVGWTLDVDYLDKVRAEMLEATGYDATIECVEFCLLLAARRVRPSPVDEDARDGVLEELALFGEQQAEALSSMANNSGAAIYRIYARKIRALQSQRKG